MKKLTFALYFGNRGFFPASLIEGARRELTEVLEKLGYGTIMTDTTLTRYGAVETMDEGRKYAEFLRANAGKYDGVILSLPNFGDENGAITALRDCGTPIFIQAYPDELGKMDPANRRDAFCGKFSIMDVFCQYKLPFTIFPPQTVSPSDKIFADQITQFAAVCRIVNNMRRFSIGAIGARTTAFKTVRFDEVALQKYGITTESFDLSDFFARVKSIDRNSGDFKARRAALAGYTNWKGVPDDRLDMHAAASTAIDKLIEEYKLDCIALRCWMEVEQELKISPCVLLSEFNDRGIPASCELDVCSAIAMKALSHASGTSAACLDWNNNYGSAQDKCVLFHCGPVAQCLMTEKGNVIDHPMFIPTVGAGNSFGCNVGRIAPSDITFAGAKTEDGKLSFYMGEGKITKDKLDDDFFGCGGVAEIPGLQNKIVNIGRNGFKHHVATTVGHFGPALREALGTYLKYDIIEI